MLWTKNTQKNDGTVSGNLEIDFDEIFYLWTVKLKLDEDSFYHSSFEKVVYLIEKWGAEQLQYAGAVTGQPLPVKKTVRKFSEIGGLI